MREEFTILSAPTDFNLVESSPVADSVDVPSTVHDGMGVGIS